MRNPCCGSSLHPSLLYARLCVCSAHAAPHPYASDQPLPPSPLPLRRYGSPAKTPHGIEYLRTHGVQLKRAYVSVAVCAPSRTAFLTGLCPDTTQVWTIGPYFRDTSRGQGMAVTTLPQWFRKNGYNTTGAGKIFHPGTPSGGISSSEGGGDMCPVRRGKRAKLCAIGAAAVAVAVAAVVVVVEEEMG